MLRTSTSDETSSHAYANRKLHTIYTGAAQSNTLNPFSPVCWAAGAGRQSLSLNPGIEDGGPNPASPRITSSINNAERERIHAHNIALEIYIRFHERWALGFHRG